MWSDAARQASMSSRGAGGGGGGLGGGGAQAAPVAASGGGGLQAGLAQAGAASRGQWGGGAAGTHSKVTIGGQGGVVATHQSGVHGVARNMKSAGAPMPTLPPAYYPNVAASSYGYGRAGMPGL